MNDNYNESEIPVKIVRHEIVDKRNEPKETENPDTINDDENVTWLEQKAFQFFDAEKRKLKEKHPEASARIDNAQSGYHLSVLEDELEEDAIPPQAPKGKATLPPQRVNSDLSEAENHPSLINRLYRTSKLRSKRDTDISRKREANSKINRLWSGIKEGGFLNPESLSRQMRGDPLSVCPQCGAVSKYLGHKGAACSTCGYIVGRGIHK